MIAENAVFAYNDCRLDLGECMASFFVTLSKVIRVVGVGAVVASKAKPYIQKVYQSRSGWKKTRDKVRLVTKYSRFVYNRGYNRGHRRRATEARQQERLLIAKRLIKMGIDKDTVCLATKINHQEL